jgi:hypothetical protein
MAEIMEYEKPVVVYRPKRYETKQKEYADESKYRENDLLLAGSFYPLLNRWKISNVIFPAIELPIRYSVERKQYEILKVPIYTESGALRVAPVGAGFENYYPIEGVAGANWSEPVAFPFIPNRIIFKSKDYGFWVKIGRSATEFENAFMIEAGERLEMDITLQVYSVKRYTGTNANYEIVGLR